MGGGDLNLKKSWHPSTMRNMEKVWKAEQKHDQEKKRIAELQREIREEKAREDLKKYAEDQGVVERKTGDVKLDWMYKGPGNTVDREEYLLGKAIDKNFEQLQRSEQQNSATICVPGRTDSCLPGSIFAGGGEQVDIARKLQEDPLLIIRKKEIESRSQLLKNPVKMKQLKELIKEQKNKKLKKHKKEKRRKVKKRSKKESSSEDSDLDDKLLAKYQKLKEKLGASGLAELQKSSFKRQDKTQQSRREQSSSDSEEEKPKYMKTASEKKYGLQSPTSGKGQSSKASKHVSEVPKTAQPTQQQQQQQQQQESVKRKLTEEEKERRRTEMLANAAWREKERKDNVARYREADRRDQSQSQRDFSDDFLRQQLSQAAAQSSVASRIKSNINNIQRSGGSMDKNFARR